MSRQPGGASIANHPSDDSVLGRYEPVIGLEVHCQLNTVSKLFCGCPTTFGALPNHATCPVCLGLPGVLPVINQKSVDQAVCLALAVGATIERSSIFARKQYFYPDLPKGYQISQYDRPYCHGGGLTLTDGKFVQLTRIHIEEDAGKNVHGDSASYVDLNRAGMPLLEIVTEPVIANALEAVDYLKRLRSLVRHLGISDGNMDEGSFRCDANVSLRRRGTTKLGTRCEIKNLNSFRNIERAINYEILRQADALDDGRPVLQQTVLFDAASGKTQVMRSKEESDDYRYFPDPDLKPLVITEERISRLRSSLPELPVAMAERFCRDYALGEADAALLTADKDLAVFYERTVARVGSDAKVVTPKIIANWISSEYLREVHEREWNLAAPPVSADDLAELLCLIDDGTISGKIAKTVFDDMVEGRGKARAIVESKGLVQISDAGAIAALVDQVLDASAGQVAQYLSGKDKIFGFFVGQIMRQCQGRMNPGMVNDVLKARLEARRS